VVPAEAVKNNESIDENGTLKGKLTSDRVVIAKDCPSHW
jgi:hypothetical protein